MRFKTLLAAALVAALASPALAHDPGLISLEGHGEISAKPDTAFLTSGVSTQGTTAREALDANTAAMAELIATLRTAGIEERDIQTSGFNVSPNYVYTDARDANGYTLPPKVNGYMVSNQVTVRVRNLGSLGVVLDQAVTVGANTISGVSFSVADPSKLNEEARKAAFADAKAKAELYAMAAGVELGSIRTITESTGYSAPQPYMMRQSAVAAMDAAPVPIAAGEMTYSISVSVVWELAD